jgi:hypothetical protein
MRDKRHAISYLIIREKAGPTMEAIMECLKTGIPILLSEAIHSTYARTKAY